MAAGCQVRVLVPGPYNNPKHDAIQAEAGDIIEIGAVYLDGLLALGFVELVDQEKWESSPAHEPDLPQKANEIFDWLKENPPVELVEMLLDQENESSRPRKTVIAALEDYIDAYRRIHNAG